MAWTQGRAAARGDGTPTRNHRRRSALRGLLAAALGALAVAAAQGPAAAQVAQRIDAERDWSIFTSESGGKTCWIASTPKSSTARRSGRVVQVNRGEIFLMVSVRPNEGVRNEVSMVSGYPYRQGSDVSLRIGSDRYTLFTDASFDQGAWAQDATTDDRIAAAMRRGTTAIVIGTSSRGTETEDRFSLLGFTAALEKAQALCG